MIVSNSLENNLVLMVMMQGMGVKRLEVIMVIIQVVHQLLFLRKLMVLVVVVVVVVVVVDIIGDWRMVIVPSVPIPIIMVLLLVVMVVVRIIMSNLFIPINKTIDTIVILIILVVNDGGCRFMGDVAGDEIHLQYLHSNFDHLSMEDSS